VLAQTEPPPPGLRLVRGGGALPPDPRDGLGRALGERLDEGAGRALGELLGEGAGRAWEPPDGLVWGWGARRVTLGRALRSVRTGPLDGAARCCGRLGVAWALGRVWGAERVLAEGRGSVRTLGCGRAELRCPAEGAERGVTLGRRSFPALGATLADGGCCVLGVARADGRS
jgi:hypothetical protein